MLSTMNDHIKQDKIGIIIWDRIEIVRTVESTVEIRFSGLNMRVEDKNTDKGHWPEG